VAANEIFFPTNLTEKGRFYVSESEKVSVHRHGILTMAFALPAAADVELTDVSWETIGSSVRFHLQFHNPDPSNPSGERERCLELAALRCVRSELRSDHFIRRAVARPDSFFDIFYDAPLSDLPRARK